jgi:hypothetical protein
MIYMIIPDMGKIPSTISVEHEGMKYVIYVTCDENTCAKCHKPGHATQNCRTMTQTRMDSVTYADLAAGRRITPPPAAHPRPHTTTDAERPVQTPTLDDATAFPVLIQPRHRLPPEDTTTITTKTQHQEEIPRTSTPTVQQTLKQTDALMQPNNPQEPEAMDDATSDPPATPTPQPQDRRTHHRQRRQQHPQPHAQHKTQEYPEGKDFTDLDSLHSDDSDEAQESTRTATTSMPTDKTTIADHKAIDTLCDRLREQGKHPISINTLSHFLKACRRQKDFKTIAKEHTTNTAGLVSMLEENLSQTKDYNLRRRMKRIITSLT